MAKSLKDMAADKANTNVRKGDLYKLNPRFIKEEDGFNLRDYTSPEVEAHIEAIKEAMLAGHHIPPILVRPDGQGNVYLVDGHCRTRAALRAIEQGADGLMLTAVNFRGNDADRIQAMLKSNDGLKFQPVEVARGYLRLENMGFEISEIAKRVGKSENHIRQYLTLATSDKAVQDMVESGEVAAQVAIDVVMKHGDNAESELLKAKQKAAAMGKKKVTNAVVKEWIPNRATVVEAIDVLRQIEDSLTFDANTSKHSFDVGDDVIHKLSELVERIGVMQEKAESRKQSK